MTTRPRTQFASCPTCGCLMCAEATSVYGTHAPASCLTFECALLPCTRDASGHAGAQSLRTRRAYPGPVRAVSTITDDRKWLLCHEDCCPCGVPDREDVRLHFAKRRGVRCCVLR